MVQDRGVPPPPSPAQRLFPDNPTPVAVAAIKRRSGGFEADEERTYHIRKFQEMRRYMLRTMLILPPLILGLWLWDWVIDPAAAPGTLVLRLGMVVCLLPCIGALARGRIGVRPFTVLLYAAVLATEVFWLGILLRLEDGLKYGVGAYLYYALGIVVISLPLRFWDTVIGLALALLLPDFGALLGLVPGFPYAKYNVLVLPAGGLVVFALWAFDRIYRRSFTYQRSVERLAGEDPLTGLANRRHFMTAGSQLLESVRRYQRTAGILVIDLDHFKRINDQHGHGGGDTVLRALAQLLKDHRRGPDLPARLGGEEFAVLLPETDLGGAAAFAERLRAALQTLRISLDGPPPAEVAVTMSVGVAACAPADPSLEAVMHRADAALYRAKRGGRNRVERA